MKKSIIILTSFAFITLGAQAQKEVTFKVKMLPDHKYSTISKINMNMEMNINGDAAVLEKIKQSGQTFPMLMSMQTATSAAVKTGSISSKNIIPYVMTIQSLPSKMVMNGVETPIPTPTTGETVYGTCTDGYKLNIDSISGKGMDATVKEAVKKSIEGITANIDFPTKPMKVGETFIQNTPMEIPVAGMATKMICKITYKLISIEGNSAKFDMVYDIAMDMSGPTLNIKMNGTGDGKFIYDMTVSYPTNMTANMNLAYSMPMPQAANMSMTGKMKMTNEQQTIITTN